MFDRGRGNVRRYGTEVLLRYYGGSDEFVSFVGDEELSRGYGPLRGFEYRFEDFGIRTFFPYRRNPNFLVRLSVPDFRFAAPRERAVFSKPFPIRKDESVREEFAFLGSAYDDTVVRYVLRHDEERFTPSYSDIPTLPNSVEPRPRMFAKFFSGSVHYVSRAFREPFTEEFPHGDFSDKTESLAVFSLGVRKTGFPGDFANL